MDFCQIFLYTVLYQPKFERYHMASTLNQLKMMTTVVADTGDLDTISRLRPVDATTNPSLITKALSNPDFQQILINTLKKHQNNIDKSIDELTIYIGSEILKRIDGRVSTEIDARLAYDTESTIAKSLEYIQAYEKLNIDRERVLIKIPATWEGIQAGRELEKQGIGCNLTLLFGLHQAKACADAKISLISPFVGRILDWQKRDENRDNIGIDEDKGVLSVKNIYSYFKQHDYKTQIMGASFRSVEQILALAGCDLLTISPDLIDQMANMDRLIERQIFPDMAFATLPKEILNKATFDEQMANDNMSKELLENGINGFIDAREQLVKNLQSLL